MFRGLPVPLGLSLLYRNLPPPSGSHQTPRWREMDSNFRFRTREATDLSFRFLSMSRNCPCSSAENHLARGRRFEIPGPAGPMGRTPDHWKTPSPRPNGLMARPGTESSNPSPSSGESVANLTPLDQAPKDPRHRQRLARRACDRE